MIEKNTTAQLTQISDEISQTRRSLVFQIPAEVMSFEYRFKGGPIKQHLPLFGVLEAQGISLQKLQPPKKNDNPNSFLVNSPSKVERGTVTAPAILPLMGFHFTADNIMPMMNNNPPDNFNKA